MLACIFVHVQCTCSYLYLPQVTDQLNIGSTNEYPSSTRLFMEWYRSVTNATASYQTVASWGTFDALESALYRSAVNKEYAIDGVLSPYEVLSSLIESQVPTPFGRIIYDEHRVNTAVKSIVVQVLPSSPTAEIVAPSDQQTATFVYPIPTWDERVYKWQLVRGAGEVSAIAIASVCSVVLLVLIVTVYVHRTGTWNRLAHIALSITT